MRKIKKALALSLALAMGLSLVACGDKTDNSTTESKSSEATSETASSEDASSEEASSEDASGAAKIEAQMDGMTARRSTLIHGMKISQRS